MVDGLVMLNRECFGKKLYVHRSIFVGLKYLCAVNCISLLMVRPDFSITTLAISSLRYLHELLPLLYADSSDYFS